MFLSEEDRTKYDKMDADRKTLLATSYGRFWDRIENYRSYYALVACNLYIDFLKRNEYRRGQKNELVGIKKAISLKTMDIFCDLAEYYGVVVHGFWWVIHNAVAHPLIAFFPLKLFFKFHDHTSNKINLKFD
jgi:hypothetical protein